MFQVPNEPVIVSCAITESFEFQLSIATQALVMGGNVRVGLEDTAYYRRGEVAKSSAQLVERVVRIARELGRDFATPDEARRMVGLERHRPSMESMTVPRAMPEVNGTSKASAA